MKFRIKEHNPKIRLSFYHIFETNQTRLFCHSGAYELIHTLQKEVLKETEIVNSSIQTIQLKLFKTSS